jgi:hypothetical protein
VAASPRGLPLDLGLQALLGGVQLFALPFLRFKHLNSIIFLYALRIGGQVRVAGSSGEAGPALVGGSWRGSAAKIISPRG